MIPPPRLLGSAPPGMVDAQLVRVQCQPLPLLTGTQPRRGLCSWSQPASLRPADLHICPISHLYISFPKSASTFLLPAVLPSCFPCLYFVSAPLPGFLLCPSLSQFLFLLLPGPQASFCILFMYFLSPSLPYPQTSLSPFALFRFFSSSSSLPCPYFILPIPTS